jgi:hypothetical protein
LARITAVVPVVLNALDICGTDRKEPTSAEVGYL